MTQFPRAHDAIFVMCASVKYTCINSSTLGAHLYHTSTNYVKFQYNFHVQTYPSNGTSVNLTRTGLALNDHI